MRKILDNSYINLIFRIILSGLFLIAATSKIAAPAEFAKEISNYQILPDFMLNIVALVLPWIELFAAMFILFGIRLKSASLTLFVLVVIFEIAILIALAKGLNINCGCHTKVMAELVGWKKIFENLILLIAAAYIYFSKGVKFTLERYIIKESILNRIAAFKNLN